MKSYSYVDANLCTEQIKIKIHKETSAIYGEMPLLNRRKAAVVWKTEKIMSMTFYKDSKSANKSAALR